MFSLNEYKETDADMIISWIGSEKVFRQWSADKYENYPPKAEDINNFYNSMKSQGAKVFSFCDDDKVIGHFLLRLLTEYEVDSVRLGFIIVDSSVRGKGYGRIMLEHALEYAFTEIGANRVTLGVFENNPNARKCYESVGFKQYGESAYNIHGEEWKCLEMEFLRKV